MARDFLLAALISGMSAASLAAQPAFDGKAFPALPGQTTAAITAEDFKARIAALADDRFEGRLPGAPKGEASADWIAEEMKRIGLKPGNGESYFQRVPAVGIAIDPSKSSFEIKTAKGSISPKFADEVAFWSPRFDKAEQLVQGSDLIFVGYGVHAPEEKWDDFAGIDVRGKTIVVLINDPGFVVGDETLFRGRAMTYYGRWTYKFEEAARRGAAAVIIVHETKPAAYGWEVVRNSNTGDKLYLDKANGNADLATIHSWITEETAKALFAAAGLDYAALRLVANKRDFRAVPMSGLALNAKTVSSVSRFTTRNVLGLVQGAKRPAEVVLFTAHWDHLGVKPNAPGTDKIHNGAVDNATGVSGILEIAEAFALAPAPARSVLFAAVTLEEQGLLGSSYMAENHVFPLKSIVGGVNFDALMPQGPSKSMSVVGYGASELEDLLKGVLKGQNRTIVPEALPERGSFYRSDHISFAKKGVPMLYASGSIDLRVGGEAAGLAIRERYTAKTYHQPNDEFSSEWDVSGPVEDLSAMHRLSLDLANSQMWPSWYPGNEFRAIRDRSRAGK